MSVVFGWNSFKVRSFTLSDIGIMKQTEPGLEFEVRQAYFHLFWIPFFGLGKRWVVRKGGKLYEMPAEIKALAQKSLTGVGTPWYTFAGPLLLLTTAIVFSAVTSYENAQSHKKSVNYFKEGADALTAKLQHLTTNDFITIETKSHPSGHVMFLKVEDIQGDDIMVTQVESNNDEPMLVEREYTKHASTLPSVKVSQKQLLKAFPKDLDSMLGDAADRQTAKLLNDDTRYIVKDVVRHFRPIVKISFANFYKDEISIRCHNEGWPATIAEMKNVVGNIDWTEIINTKFPSERSSSSMYTLDGKNAKYGQPYKFVMTLKDSTGHLYKYEIDGRGNNTDIKIQEL
jgi:hypothetical protein